MLLLTLTLRQAVAGKITHHLVASEFSSTSAAVFFSVNVVAKLRQKPSFKALLDAGVIEHVAGARYRIPDSLLVLTQVTTETKPDHTF
jgi:hypothetical protein